MYKKIVLLLVFLVAISIQGQSQSLARRVTEAKVNIIKASLEFLINDSTVVNPIVEKICTSCKDYAGLKKFANTNKIKGGRPLIDQWRLWKIDTLDEAKANTDLSLFASKVDSSITTGKHEERKQIRGYEEYHEQIITLKIKPASQDSSTEISTVNNLKNDFQADAETPSKSGSWFYSANTLYGALGVIVLLLAFILFRNNNDQKKGGKLLKDLKRIREERDQLRHEIENLRNALNEVKALREEDKFELDKLKVELSSAALKQKVAAEEEEEASNTVVWDKPEAPQKIQETFYSRYADLVDGFSASELLTKEGNDTVFEITILSPNKASFKVSSNPAAQKYALSNADYFLEPTCHYDTLPSGTIVNESPGSLTLIGGKWEIKEQAKISFR